ncbi:aminotransferase class IV [bacterium AH-315-P13]|nr:aminotransferase class IV [bacterium AH-315-P13]
MKFYIVIPAHNEEDSIGLTLDSLVMQSHLPKCVVVVNDNSIDDTEQIIEAFATKYSWITLVNSNSSDEHLPGTKIINAFYKGFDTLDDNYDVICKYDADLIFPENYLEILVNHFNADEFFIGMRAATNYKFIIIASPSGPYFSKPIKLFAETKYIRATQGGTGEAKAAGNYAAAIKPSEIAKAKGYDQVLWLDAHDFSYIQEAGTMNLFFKINGEFITPSLDGAILSGITRMSVMELLESKVYKVTERPITIEELIEASKNGTLEEAFGTGTAVGIAMIAEIRFKETTINLPEENPDTQMISDTLNGVRSGKMEDKLNWMVKIEQELV